MANIRSSAKRARQAQVRTKRNRSVLTNLKSQLKKTATATTEAATEGARKLVSALDKAAKTGRIHRNKANRHKRQIAKRNAAAKS